MAVLIRPIRESDAADVARLTGQLGYDLAPTDAAARLSRILSRPNQLFVGADVDSRLVGWLHATVCEYIETDAFVLIGGLVVDVRHRQHGIGRRLIEHAEGWAREQGCSVARLWSSVARTDSHRFYEHLGYTNVKTQHAFVKSLEPGRHLEPGRFVPRVEQ
jgi:GNAT superfamily N-acetyltransferase